jgi:hypothetical protein
MVGDGGTDDARGRLLELLALGGPRDIDVGGISDWVGMAESEWGRDGALPCGMASFMNGSATFANAAFIVFDILCCGLGIGCGLDGGGTVGGYGERLLSGWGIDNAGADPCWYEPAGEGVCPVNGMKPPTKPGGTAGLSLLRSRCPASASASKAWTRSSLRDMVCVMTVKM